MSEAILLPSILPSVELFLRSPSFARAPPSSAAHGTLKSGSCLLRSRRGDRAVCWHALQGHGRWQRASRDSEPQRVLHSRGRIWRRAAVPGGPASRWTTSSPAASARRPAGPSCGPPTPGPPPSAPQTRRTAALGPPSRRCTQGSLPGEAGAAAKSGVTRPGLQVTRELTHKGSRKGHPEAELPAAEAAPAAVPASSSSRSRSRNKQYKPANARSAKGTPQERAQPAGAPPAAEPGAEAQQPLAAADVVHQQQREDPAQSAKAAGAQQKRKRAGNARKGAPAQPHAAPAGSDVPDLAPAEPPAQASQGPTAQPEPVIKRRKLGSTAVREQKQGQEAASEPADGHEATRHASHAQAAGQPQPGTAAAAALLSREGRAAAAPAGPAQPAAGQQASLQAGGPQPAAGRASADGQAVGAAADPFGRLQVSAVAGSPGLHTAGLAG